MLRGCDLQYVGTKVGETFSDYLRHSGERPHESIFLEKLKSKNFQFLESPVPTLTMIVRKEVKLHTNSV